MLCALTEVSSTGREIPMLSSDGGGGIDRTYGDIMVMRGTQVSTLWHDSYILGPFDRRNEPILGLV